jgi:hypothetical protein
VNRKQRRALGFRREWTAAEFIEALERLGPILWEPDSSPGRFEGWAICPCCGQRNLWVSFPVAQDATCA